jgi:hypothetical protein
MAPGRIVLELPLHLLTDEVQVAEVSADGGPAQSELGRQDDGGVSVAVLSQLRAPPTLERSTWGKEVNCEGVDELFSRTRRMVDDPFGGVGVLEDVVPEFVSQGEPAAAGILTAIDEGHSALANAQVGTIQDIGAEVQGEREQAGPLDDPLQLPDGSGFELQVPPEGFCGRFGILDRLDLGSGLELSFCLEQAKLLQ